MTVAYGRFLYLLLGHRQRRYYVPILPYDVSNGSGSSLNKSCCSTANNCSNCSNSDGNCTIREQIECYINGDNLQR